MSSPDVARTDFRWGARIPLRDGARLSAAIYAPRGGAPAPCILAMTPYGADGWHGFGLYFAARGMAFVIIDVRGRGDSDGTFRSSVHESADGYDAVEWAAAQPFCNGQVAMYGASYLGYCQWAAARAFPPHLAAIAPTAAPFSGVDAPMRNNIFYPFLTKWLTKVAGRGLQGRIGADDAFWSAQYRRWHESGAPFRELDRMVGHPSDEFQESLAHPEPDAFWDAQNPTAEDYSRLDLPILSITGAYDDEQPGALEHYRRHMQSASPAARDRHYLIIGPWDHGGTQWPAADFGGVGFGPDSVIDIRRLHLEWYRWTLQGGGRPEFLKQRVAYYVTGAERWRYADTLEEVTGRTQPWFLQSDGQAGDIFASGVLGAAAGSGPPDAYTYDPRVLDGPEVEAEAGAQGGSLTDQSLVLALSGRQFVYHSPPFEEEVEISGCFKLSAWISIDCPDTDFYVSVHEIGPDGASLRLSTDVMRARYRQGLRTPRLITTTEPLLYEFDRFTFVSRLVRRGSRLRLVIAPMGRVIDATFVQKNYNAGGVVSEETVADARPVTVRLFHDPQHPSILTMPIGRADKAAAPRESEG